MTTQNSGISGVQWECSGRITLLPAIQQSANPNLMGPAFPQNSEQISKQCVNSQMMT